MFKPFAGFVGGSYKSASWKASTQRCVNLFLEEDPEQGAVLYNTPGQFAVATFGFAPVLAMETTPSGLLVVTADGLYWAQDFQDNAFIGVSTILLTSSAYAIVAQANDKLMVVNGDQAFAIDRTAQTVSIITGDDFPTNPISCAAVDGYFLVHGPDTDKFYWSAPFDPTSWDPLDFATAENLNDKLQRIVVLERDVYLIGSLSTEIWATTADEQVFQRIQGTYIPFGTNARLSPGVIGQNLYFLSQDQQGGSVVIRARGLQWERVTTQAIEAEVAGYLVTEDAFSLTYQQGGHPFYCLTFPTARKTWCYDFSTGFWHERSTQILDPVQPNQSPPFSYVPGAWSARCHAYFRNTNFVGSSSGPGVSRLGTDIYTDNNVDIIRTRTTPHVSDSQNFMTIAGIQVVFRPGVGDGSGVGASTNPKARLRISRDGGQTYRSAREVSIGRQGNYLGRAVWWRLGRARDFVAEVTISARVPVAINGAGIDLVP